MGRTLEQLRELVQQNVNRPDKDTVVDAALNFGLDEITNRHTFKGRRTEIEVSVAVDEFSFPIPDGMTHVSNVRVVDEADTLVHKLCIQSKNTLMRQFPGLTANNNTSGTPAYAYEEAGVVYFFPMASQTFTMLVTGDFQGGHMVEETDEVGVEGIDEALIAYATAYTFRSIQQNEEANIWEANFERRLITAIRNDNRRAAEERQLEGFPGPSKGYDVDPVKDPFYGQR